MTMTLIASMERDVEEAGLGGWYNGNPEDVPESWSGSNSGASASQDRVGTTLLTTIGGRTLPNPVRVPDNVIHSVVLTTLMEGPVQPWQCLVWSETSPPRYSHTGGKGSITQWVHAEYMEGSETICPTFTQWVRGGYFSKVPTKVPTG